MNKSSQVKPQLVYIIAWIFVIVTIALGLFLLYQEYRVYKNPEILVKWKTGSELDIVGFNILRSSNPTNDYLQINSSLIPAALDPLGGNDYEYLDNDVEVNIQYYYQLEAISMDGSIDLYGPIKSSVQKMPISGIAPAILSLLTGFVTLIALLKSGLIRR